MKIWHIALISFKKDVSDNIKEEIFDYLQMLGQNCGGQESGIIFWNAGKNLDLRKGVHLVLISVFENDEALQKYRQHPKHKEFTGYLSKVADWQIGDMPTLGLLQPTH